MSNLSQHSEGLQSQTFSDAPLWTPSPERIKASNVSRFLCFLKQRDGTAPETFQGLHAQSIARRDWFWSALWDFFKVVGERGERTLIHDTMPGAQFFPDARLNFAENLLRRRDSSEAIVFQAEHGDAVRLTWADLQARVSRVQQWLRAQGLAVNERVAALMPNLPDTITAMLATTACGAAWSSCSPDFGVQGVLDRFSQIGPSVLVVVDGYWYGGKRVDISDKVVEIAARLPSVRAILIVPFVSDGTALAAKLANSILLPDLLKAYPEEPVQFERLPFDHPLYILYSSGTTGVPKCIVHGAGGALLQLMKEHSLHCDVRPGDRMFYFTTCSWMMWNWLVSGLACEATLILFDGSPFYPHPSALFDLAQRERVTLFGTSAKYIDACRKADLKPAKTHDLSALRTITSTGSPLSNEAFRSVYETVKSDVHLASISGGTDIVSCFVLGDPTSPVWAGEIQTAGLGLAVDVWNEDGHPVVGEKGELVCTHAFPSMPLKFWNDPDGSRYRAAYFERFPGVWTHGDFAEITPHGGLIIHGRSDTTLNPGGVRIGTAEIYAQVERIPEVIESVVIGQEFDGDVRVVLFVRLRESEALDDALVSRIRRTIREGASPRHVPAKILAVKDIPRTKSGKTTEIAVRDVVHGQAVKNTEALANPETLELFKDLPELRV